MVGPIDSLTDSTTLIDIITRHDCNESLINSFYVLWTIFSYVPAFFFTTCCITLSLLNICNPSSTLITLTLVCYVETIWDYVSLNRTLLSYQFSLSSINPLLLNNVNKYHPCLLYLSASMVILSTTYLPNYLLRLTGCGIEGCLKVLNLRHTATFCLITLSLFLGSWWALQEGSWGGWWDSDISEMLGLLIFVLVIVFFHSSELYQIVATNFLKSISAIQILILYYLLVQLNFEQSAHNFGSKSFFFFSSSLVYSNILPPVLLLLQLSLLLTLYLFSDSKYVTFVGLRSPHRYILERHLVKVSTFSVLFAWLLLSTSLSLTNDSWKLDSSKSFDIEVLLAWFYFNLCSVLLATFLSGKNLQWGYNLFASTRPNSIKRVLSALQQMPSLYNSLRFSHFLLILFTLANLNDSSDSLNLNDILSTLSHNQSHKSLIWSESSCVVLDSVMAYRAEVLMSNNLTTHHTLTHTYLSNMTDAPIQFLLSSNVDALVIKLEPTSRVSIARISNFVGVSNLANLTITLLGMWLKLPTGYTFNPR